MGSGVTIFLWKTKAIDNLAINVTNAPIKRIHVRVSLSDITPTDSPLPRNEVCGFMKNRNLTFDSNSLSILEDLLFTVSEAASFLKVEVSTIYAWVHQRKIPFRKHGRRTVFSKLALLNWSASQETSPEPLTFSASELKSVSTKLEDNNSGSSLKIRRDMNDSTST